MKTIFGLLLALMILQGCESKDAPAAKVAEPVAPTPAPIAVMPTGQLMNNVGITVMGNDNLAGYPIVNTLDADSNSFMHTSNLIAGDIKYIAYQFPNAVDLSCIKLVDDYTNAYALGDLEVLVSTDSTNGVDGTWSNLASMTKNTTNFINGDGVIFINSVGTKWLKLKMSFTGTGGFGASPAFYLSDISFYENI